MRKIRFCRFFKEFWKLRNFDFSDFWVFGVFEYNIHLDKNCRYEFIMKGTVDKDYRISDFMLRPSTSNVYVVKQKGDTLINNFSKQ